MDEPARASATLANESLRCSRSRSSEPPRTDRALKIRVMLSKIFSRSSAGWSMPAAARCVLPRKRRVASAPRSQASLTVPVLFAAPLAPRAMPATPPTRTSVRSPATRPRAAVTPVAPAALLSLHRPAAPLARATEVPSAEPYACPRRGSRRSRRGSHALRPDLGRSRLARQSRASRSSHDHRGAAARRGDVVICATIAVIDQGSAAPCPASLPPAEPLAPSAERRGRPARRTQPTALCIAPSANRSTPTAAALGRLTRAVRHLADDCIELTRTVRHLADFSARPPPIAVILPRDPADCRSSHRSRTPHLQSAATLVAAAGLSNRFTVRFTPLVPRAKHLATSDDDLSRASEEAAAYPRGSHVIAQTRARRAPPYIEIAARRKKSIGKFGKLRRPSNT
jgi:hypothetical protein